MTDWKPREGTGAQWRGEWEIRVGPFRLAYYEGERLSAYAYIWHGTDPILINHRISSKEQALAWAKEETQKIIANALEFEQTLFGEDQ